MSIINSKVQCTVQFSLERASTLQPPLPAVMHLHEYAYDRSFSFWFGVLEITCPADALQITVDEPESVRAIVECADGRTGTARYLHGHTFVENQGDSYRLALVGVTPLK